MTHGTRGLDPPWWLVRDVARVGDADFAIDPMIARYHEHLANGLGGVEDCRGADAVPA